MTAPNSDPLEGFTETMRDDTESFVTVTRQEWVLVKQQIADVHRIITDLEANVKPALESIAKGGIMSALMGRKKS